MEVIGIIPARFGSTRFEGKVLAEICGKPMIQHIWEKAKEAKVLEDLLVATDDERVAKVVEGFRGKAILTAKEQQSGTDRIVEAAFSMDARIIVNIQADEPLIQPSQIDILADALISDPEVYMATLAKKIKSEEDINDPNVVKVITDRNGFAIYFSRSPIPYPGNRETAVYYKHLGLYAYTKDFLFTYVNLRDSMLEKTEKLEQLRALENGYKIKVIETNLDTIGVDTPEDLIKVENILKGRSA